MAEPLLPPTATPPGGDDPSGAPTDALSPGRLTWRRLRRDPLAMASAAYLVAMVVVAALAPWIAPYGYEAVDISRRGRAPTFDGWHLFGTDQIGRDHLSRVLYGMRTSLQVAVVVAVLSTMIGVTVGLVAGYYRRWLDGLLMRLTDLVLVVPTLVVLLVVARYYGGGDPRRIAVILALLLWPPIARVTRGVVRSLREQELVLAARACGASDLRILRRHVLPGALGPILVNLTLVLATAILAEATLAFLGLGVQPPTPALGVLLEQGRGSALTYWWLTLFPGLVLVSITLAVSFVGDGLRDALDPIGPQRRRRR